MGPRRRRFDFPRAGLGAPAAVRALIGIVRRLPERKRGVMSLWARLLGPMGTPPYKLDPRDVAYASPSRTPRQTCGNCTSFYLHVGTQTAICDAVRSRVYAKDWCDRWVAVVSREEYVAYQGGDARKIIRDPTAPVVGKPLPLRMSRFRPLVYAMVGILLGITANAWGQDPSVEVLTALSEPGNASAYLWAKVVAEGGLPVVLGLLLALIARGVPIKVSFSDADRELLRGLKGGRGGES